MLEEIKKIREYLSYLEEHVCNVKWAWEKMIDIFGFEEFVQDPYMFGRISKLIANHDASKISDVEFDPYRRHFYPTFDEQMIDAKYVTTKQYYDDMYEAAWQAHLTLNPHHWENWTKLYDVGASEKDIAIHIITMLCDWIAMARFNGGTALKWYEENKQTIMIPQFAHDLVSELLTEFYKSPFVLYRVEGGDYESNQ